MHKEEKTDKIPISMRVEGGPRVGDTKAPCLCLTKLLLTTTEQQSSDATA